MGRHYDGDISGKFWLGIQSSDDADFFGVIGEPPTSDLYYCFNNNNLGKVKKGIETCKKELGIYKEKIDKFFKNLESGWNEEMLVDLLGINRNKVDRLMEWYARLELGQKIMDCIVKNGECSFDAEI